MSAFDLGPATIALPDGWRPVSVVFIAPTTSGPRTLLKPTGSSAFRETVAVSIEPVAKGMKPQRYLEGQVKQMRAGGQEVEVVSSEPIDRGPRKGLAAELSVTGATGERLRMLQHVFISGREAWTAIAQGLDNTSWPKARERLAAVLDTLSFA